MSKHMSGGCYEASGYNIMEVKKMKKSQASPKVKQKNVNTKQLDTKGKNPNGIRKKGRT